MRRLGWVLGLGMALVVAGLLVWRLSPDSGGPQELLVVSGEGTSTDWVRYDRQGEEIGRVTVDLGQEDLGGTFFQAGGRVVTTDDSGEVLLVDPRSGDTQSIPVPDDHTVIPVRGAPDLALIGSTQGADSAQVVDVRRGETVAVSAPGAFFTLSSYAVSPDGDALALTDLGGEDAGSVVVELGDPGTQHTVPGRVLGLTDDAVVALEGSGPDDRSLVFRDLEGEERERVDAPEILGVAALEDGLLVLEESGLSWVREGEEPQPLDVDGVGEDIDGTSLIRLTPDRALLTIDAGDDGAQSGAAILLTSGGDEVGRVELGSEDATAPGWWDADCVVLGRPGDAATVVGLEDAQVLARASEDNRYGTGSAGCGVSVRDGEAWSTVGHDRELPAEGRRSQPVAISADGSALVLREDSATGLYSMDSDEDPVELPEERARYLFIDP